jgi:hypothetical protein
MAVNRDVIARWVPALTPDIVAQKITWNLNGANVVEKLIGARVTSRSFCKDFPIVRLQEGDKVEFSVCSIDEFGESTGVTASHQFVLTEPDPPSNLKLTEKIRYRRVP